MVKDIYSQIWKEAEDLFEYSVKIRRDIHAYPELGLRENRTSDLIARELKKLNCEVIRGIGVTGVVGIFQGRKPGPTLLVRFDMDALPIQEENNCEYASKNPGVMHACGHDGHVAIGLTTVKIISTLLDQISGTVKFVFQPAEEGLGGAVRMIQDGVLENPAPEKCFSLHVWNERPVGWVAVTEGPLMAAADFFTINLTGKGGHGAMPHQAIDPVLAGSHLVCALQSIVSRNISPIKTAVVSVSQFHSGEAPNVIPQGAILRGTIRTFEPEIRESVLLRFEQIIRGISSGFGCTAEFDVQKLTLPVINQPELAKAALAAVNKVVPGLHIETDFRSMVSEDMSFFMEKIPGVYLLVGSANLEEGKSFPHHHPRFDFDEKALTIGSSIISGVIVDQLIPGN